MNKDINTTLDRGVNLVVFHVMLKPSQPESQGLHILNKIYMHFQLCSIYQGYWSLYADGCMYCI